MKKVSCIIAISLVTLISITVYQYFLFNDGRLHVVMCDVGQGEALYIRHPSGTDMLVDAGPDKSVLSCLNGHMPFWDRTIDVAILTNADLDHYGGYLDVAKQYKIGQFITTYVGKNDEGFESLEEIIQRQKVKVYTMSAGDILRDRSVIYRSVWPDKKDANGLSPQTGKVVLGAYAAQETVNPYSLVLQMTYGEFDLLLTGDIIPPATDEMSTALGKVEVLKVPHHGSKNGLTKKLLEAAAPKIALISAGKSNMFGHPDIKTLSLLQESQVSIYRTDHLGDIEVITDGKNWSVR